MAAATIERPKAKRAAAAAIQAAPQPAATPYLTFAFRDRLLNDLHTTDAAATMLKMVFAGDGFEEPKKVDGLMGTLQFLNSTLNALARGVEEAESPPDDLYWGLHHASSLAALLEELQWSDDFKWTMGDGFLCDCLSAITDSIDKAIEAAEAAEVTR